MRKRQISIGVVFALVMAFAPAFGVQYVDLDFPLDWLEEGELHKGNFNILDDGFNPVAETATDTTIKVGFIDDWDWWDNENAKLFLELEVGLWDSGVFEVDTGVESWTFALPHPVVLAFQDGVMNYGIKSWTSRGDNDFLVAWTKAIVTAEPAAVPVDGATGILLAIGVALLGAARSKIRS